MAAGAIPPPLFFEQRRIYPSKDGEHFGSEAWHPQEHSEQIRPNKYAEQTQRRSHHLNGRRAQARPPER
jgi:hypothetical protein